MMNERIFAIGHNVHRHRRNVPLLLHRQFAIRLADALRAFQRPEESKAGPDIDPDQVAGNAAAKRPSLCAKL